MCCVSRQIPPARHLEVRDLPAIAALACDILHAAKAFGVMAAFWGGRRVVAVSTMGSKSQACRSSLPLLWRGTWPVELLCGRQLLTGYLAIFHGC
jgi:hypothetical protein